MKETDPSLLAKVLMRILLVLLISIFVASTSSGALISGIATGVTPTTAVGTLNGVGWTATASATSPFVGINLTPGTWDVPSSSPPANGLFLSAESTNAGDSHSFAFDQPIAAITFYVENFDSNSLEEKVVVVNEVMHKQLELPGRNVGRLP